MAYLPYVEQPSITIGPLTIHAFGVIVAAAVLAGLTIGARRFRSVGLDRHLGERMAWWAIVGGFVGAHLFSVIFYFPRELADNPLLLFMVWRDIASFGSILGGFAGIWLFFRLKARTTDIATRWAYVDVAAFVFPFALMIGRIACSLAHDHPGTITDFPLAISLATSRAQEYIAGVYSSAGRAAEVPSPAELAQLGFHDLGWYEFLYLAVVVVPITIALARRTNQRRAHMPGTFLASFIVLYMPVRFALDFLRVSDERYAGLTPAQWVVLVVVALLPVLLRYLRRLKVSSRSSDLIVPPTFASTRKGILDGV